MRVEGVELRKGGREILRGADLTVAAGGITVLLGPNGCGKTSLLRCVNRIWHRTGGEIRVLGRPQEAYTQAELARTVGYVPQDHSPTFAYTCLEVVLMGRAPHTGLFAAPGRADREVALGALARVGASVLARRVLAELSGGERQLVLLARCLAQEPRVLLLDEPTSHLDLRNQVRVLTAVRRVARDRGVGVLATLHDPNLALLFADAVALMERGRVLCQGPPQEVVTPGHLRRVYGVEVDLAFCPGGGRHLVAPRVPDHGPAGSGEVPDSRPHTIEGGAL